MGPATHPDWLFSGPARGRARVGNVTVPARPAAGHGSGMSPCRPGPRQGTVGNGHRAGPARQEIPGAAARLPRRRAYGHGMPDMAAFCMSTSSLSLCSMRTPTFSAGARPPSDMWERRKFVVEPPRLQDGSCHARLSPGGSMSLSVRLNLSCPLLFARWFLMCVSRRVSSTPPCQMPRGALIVWHPARRLS